MNRGKSVATATVNAQLVSSLQQLALALQAMTSTSSQAKASEGIAPIATSSQTVQQRSTATTPRTSTTVSAVSSAVKSNAPVNESFKDMNDGAFEGEFNEYMTQKFDDVATAKGDADEVIKSEDIFTAAERRLRSNGAISNGIADDVPFDMLCEEALKSVSISQFGGKDSMKVAKRMLTGEREIDVEKLTFDDEQVEAAVRETLDEMEQEKALRAAQREEAIREAREMEGRAWIFDLPEVKRLRKITKAKYAAEKKLRQVQMQRAKLQAQQRTAAKF